MEKPNAIKIHESPLSESSIIAGSTTVISPQIQQFIDCPMPPTDEIKTMLELLMEDLNLTEVSYLITIKG